MPVQATLWLTSSALSYVKNIDPGLPLFLFNYSNRKLHGIFEAASTGQMSINPYGWTTYGAERTHYPAGQMSINPYGWTTYGAERTHYPAQVQIRVQMQCQPLREEQFKPIFLENYYSHNHFWFELSLAIAPSTPIPGNTEKWRNMFQANNMLEPMERGERFKPVASPLEEDKRVQADHSDVNEQNEKELVLKQPEELALECTSQYSFLRDTVEGIASPYGVHLEEKDSPVKLMSSEKNEESPCSSSHCQSMPS